MHAKENAPSTRPMVTARRKLLVNGGAAALVTAWRPPAAPKARAAADGAASPSHRSPYITTRDGVQLYYKDWGPRDGQPIVFSHGWPLSSDSWDPQMLFFANH